MMAIAAGTSAAEGRWVELKELAPVLCEAVPVGEGLEYGACEAAIVDGESGALRFDVITNPRRLRQIATTCLLFRGGGRGTKNKTKSWKTCGGKCLEQKTTYTCLGASKCGVRGESLWSTSTLFLFTPEVKR